MHEVKPLSLVVGLIDELRKRHPDLDENLISDVILGCVSPVGDQGGDIARAAVRRIESGVPATSGLPKPPFQTENRHEIQRRGGPAMATRHPQPATAPIITPTSSVHRRGANTCLTGVC
ncbi:hypothetical protein TBKG_00683 [Mycobacterium tuberculosis '98-R604 INH-RIF-EM']|nr:hypothetical protein TBKG_00683 [Mycobacterium tuberculosis '98-R604 INH-RIF-EM']